MSHHAFCCAHPQRRIDSPEPPARPPITIDGIFAAAALAEDHPHALRFAEKKKAEVATSIMRSPNIANKIKSQFRRKSLKALRSDEQYDSDAQHMTSTDAVDNVEHVDEDTDADANIGYPLHRFGSVRALETPLGRNFEEDVRASVLKSLDWLRPLLTRPSDFTTSRPQSVVDPPTRAAPRRHASDSMASLPAAAIKLPQSLSSPNLLGGQPKALTPLRRTQSFFGLGSMLTVPKTGTRTSSSESSWPASLLKSPFLHGGGPSQLDGAGSYPEAANQTASYPEAVTSSTESEDEQDNKPEIDHPSRQSDRAHLHTMAISQQLRSMSAMSDGACEEDSLLQPHSVWNFHRRERSDIGGFSHRSRHSNTQSAPCFQFETIAQAGVRSPAASSIYSRPSSITVPELDKKEMPYEITNQLDGALSDWPLRSTVPLNATSGADQGDTQNAIPGAGGVEPVDKPTKEVKSTDAAPSITTADYDDSSVSWLSPPERDSFIQSKNSSSNLTTSSKRSRFFERISPAKKTVKKRRSIFKFLRPGSRKQQIRSISSPILCTKTSHTSGVYDGPSDDPSLLTVQYELTDNPHHAGRSASVSRLTPSVRDTEPFLAVPGLPQRRPSMADYERSLTVAGDDRRRPSALNLEKLQEVQEDELDDRRQSMRPRGKLSRAKPLELGDEPPTGLMAQALEKHQQEKALFRSASKQRESLDAQRDRHRPIFRTDTLSASATSLPAPSSGDRNDSHDPFQRPDTKASAWRSHSTSHLTTPGTPLATPFRYAPAAAGVDTRAFGRAGSVAVPPDIVEPRGMSRKIGTTLASWSRFPSHSRPDRCTSAGGADAVLTRDFAIDATSDDFEDIEEDHVKRPRGKRATKPRSRHLPKRRSTMLGGLMNYYSNVFSSTGSNTAQNRRSSIAAGGWLANPDLELLPPTSSSEPVFPHHDHHLRQRLQELEHQLEETVRDDINFVEEEAQKLGRALRKDVDFVEEEAQKFEDQVRKDVEYVEDEAEKFMHPQSLQQPVNAGSNLFLEVSPFRADKDHPHLHRDSTFMGPLDEPGEDPLTSERGADGAERNVALDGAGPEPSEPKKLAKAEAWSDLYKECLLGPRLTVTEHDVERALLPHTEGTDGTSMGPPALKPTKTRSPEQPKRLDPKASVRRFPSVTVVDDRKGHSRSVSLISVKVDGGSIYRSSTNDLLQLIKAREQEERERLLTGLLNGAQDSGYA